MSTASWRQRCRPGKPTVFHIPPDLPFVDLLAQGLIDDAGPEPLALASFTVLLPTRRSIRSLRDAFLRRTGGRTVLLPRLTPLNDLGDDDDALLPGSGDDLDDLPPPIDGLRRLIILTRLVLAYLKDVEPHRAVALASELARLLDQVETEQLGFERLAELVPAELAQHWQITIEFLTILSTAWPQVLADESCLDPAEHRNRAFARRSAAWQAVSPGPVVAAGSTGSVPATAGLLATIANLPEGCIVLPGLDLDLDRDAWAAIDEAHPQHGMKKLLDRIGIDRDHVELWPPCVGLSGNAARRKLASEVMRPASTSDRWLDLKDKLGADSVTGVFCIEAPTRREEAAAIALAMRGALEQPDQTCALITPDRDLADRVASELGRWGISINDSAGQRLDRTPVGAFLCLLADMVAQEFAPIPLLSVCKHPLAAAGIDPAAFRKLTRSAEIALLRGPRPAPGMIGLRRLAAAASAPPEALEWIERLEICTPFAALMNQKLAATAQLVEAHMLCAEQLAEAPDQPGQLRLWSGDSGDAAATFAAELARAADALPAISPRAYPALFARLLATRVSRPRYGQHPRLAILGPLEARLQRFDTMILGGLNEGTWPAAVTIDPWMSRPMRKNFGLPPLERSIGLAAHDIAHGLCAPQVILTRALKVDGTPAVASRWLRRLDQVVSAADLDKHWQGRRTSWSDWSTALTRPSVFAPAGAPAACPPVSARPRRMSVTRVEEWMRDPYGTYARLVLRLSALDPIDQEPGAADFGTALHRILEIFVARRPADAGMGLLAIGRDVFSSVIARPGVTAFWWPRFERIAAWIAEHEAAIAPGLSASFTEVKGQMTMSGPGGAFTLTATADRIDVRNGDLIVIDYKTGKPPGEKDIAAGYAPQLPLEAAIAAAGGFQGVPDRPVGSLEYWRLSGRGAGGEVSTVGDGGVALGAAARAGLQGLIDAFDQPETCYRARPHPAHLPNYSDYEHLARVREWAALDGDGDDK